MTELPRSGKAARGEPRARGDRGPLAPLAAILFALLSATASPLAARQSSRQAPQAPEAIPRLLLERPIALAQGIGKVHQSVKTTSPQAQAFYDQGLAYLQSYMWIWAARSFYQALRLDPKLPMAALGLVDAYIGLQDVPAARSALEQAAALGKSGGAEEQTWLTIRQREVEYIESGGDPDRYVAYRQAINAALKLYPNDPWLWIQRGLADEGSPFAHGQAGGVDTLAFYKVAIDLDPDNFAAHHYYTHTLENLGRVEEALGEATTYVRLAPDVPHAHHMRGHELLRLGRTEEAIQEFLKARQLEEADDRAAGIPARYDWHYSHNLQLLAMAYESLGQMKAAQDLLREAFALPAYTDFLAYNRREWPEFLLRRGRFSETLEASRELAASRWPMARMAGHALAGEALLALGHRDQAEQELMQAERDTEQVPAKVVAALPYPALLRANLLLRDDPLQGESLMKSIEAGLRVMPGPDAWCEARFELESIAATARRVGAWDLAQYTARQMIEEDPNYAGAYYALGRVAEHRGDAAEARRAFAAAARFWSKADSDLPELKHVRETVSTLR